MGFLFAFGMPVLDDAVCADVLWPALLWAALLWVDAPLAEEPVEVAAEEDPHAAAITPREHRSANDPPQLFLPDLPIACPSAAFEPRPEIPGGDSLPGEPKTLDTPRRDPRNPR
jgi:hypothetical protein